MKNILTYLLAFVSLQCFAQKKANNISLVLPFCSKQIIADPNYKDAELGNLCREYYQGTLIALDSFERANVRVRLSVFDTENDSLTTYRITQKTAFKESELIIGPVRQGGNKVLSQFAKKNNVFHVSPLMTFSKTKLDDPFWVSANPDLPSYANILFKYITSADANAQIVVVADKSIIGKSISAAFKQLLADNKKARIKVIEYAPNFTIEPYVSSIDNNHIVVAATQENAVNVTLRSIKDTTSINGLHTYGLMQWFDFKNVDYNLFQRCNTFFVSPFYIDYSRADVIDFVSRYRERFNTDPTEAAFKGYDHMLLFGSALNKEGKKFMDVLDKEPVKLLGTTYNFVKQKESCYQTVYLNILKLDNYVLRKLN
jgi:ABC-type branched-subunit amino acid transport system substrate-binding protein